MQNPQNTALPPCDDIGNTAAFFDPRSRLPGITCIPVDDTDYEDIEISNPTPESIIQPNQIQNLQLPPCNDTNSDELGIPGLTCIQIEPNPGPKIGVDP